MVVFKNILLLIVGAVGMSVGIIAGIGIVKDVIHKHKFKVLRNKGVK